MKAIIKVIYEDLIYSFLFALIAFPKQQQRLQLRHIASPIKLQHIFSNFFIINYKFKIY